MQHTVSKPAGSRPVTIEVDGEPLGVVVPDAEGFRFLAVRFNAFGIDGQTFASVAAAQLAASRAVHEHPAD
jgi:hypothetical protein